MKLRFNQLFRPLSGIFLAVLLIGCGQDDPAGSAPNSVEQAVAPLSDADAKIIALSDAEAEVAATQALGQVNLQPAEGLKVDLWAPTNLLGDPVAINVDWQGRVWATVTQRSNNSEFDIRGYPQWEIPSMGFESVTDRRNFLREELAPEKSAQNEWLQDRNKDGSHDWRDLAVVKEEVVLLQDTTGNGRANQSRLFLKDFNAEVTDVLGGIYYHNQSDELFLGVAPNAWRVKDTDGDLRADTKTSLAEGFGIHIGFSGHGMSGVVQGPDGRIYYGIGDIGANITDLSGKQWPYPNQGVIVRSELDGSNFEVFAAGLRNTHEFSFDQYGNLISVDNDGDHEGESERLVYLIDGSDSGWRTNWQLGKYKNPANNSYKVWMDEDYYKPRFDNQAAHILPPIAPYHSGPAGMVYNPGTALSEEWRNHFFVVEFVGSAPRSGINAFTLEPKGASFTLASDQNIFRGVQATGLDFGPEGALYMGDWVDGWQTNGTGRVWKMDVTEGADSDLRRETAKLLAADFGALNIEQLTSQLQNPDMRVRQKAQFELVTRGEQATLEQVALHGEQQLARIHAIWGLGQLARRDTEQAALLMPLLRDKDTEIRAQVAEVLGDVSYAEAGPALIDLLKDESLRVQLFAAQALGRVGDQQAVAPLVAMLAANNDEDVYLRHAGAIALARIGAEQALGRLAEHESEAVRIAAVVALKRLQSPELEGFLNDESEFVVTNAARAISDDHFVKEAMPALATLLETTPFANEPLVRRAINANLYTGGKASAERLLDFALREDVAGPLRAEAIATLAVWSGSSVFDRVTGRYRGAVSYPEEEASAPFAAQYAALLSDADADVRLATLAALSALHIGSAVEQVVQRLNEDTVPEVRVTALKTLLELGYQGMGDVVQTAMNDSHQRVRMAALKLLPELDLPVADVVRMHQLLLRNGTWSEQQVAYRSLANVDHERAHQVLGDALDSLMADDLPAEVQLDLIEAVRATQAEALLAKLEVYEAGKDQADPLDIYRESLHGGDPQAGRTLFRYSSQAQCVRCHMIGHQGAKVGPELTSIGQTLSREQLLQALVDPGAQVAAGYGRVSVTLKDGRTIGGFFEAETDTTMTIVDQDKTTEVAKADVVTKKFSGSGMPPMGYLLSREEIRDLIAYLSTLPNGEAAPGH
jgi:quinoprotein glucose dehydrogenase